MRWSLPRAACRAFALVLGLALSACGGGGGSGVGDGGGGPPDPGGGGGGGGGGPPPAFSPTSLTPMASYSEADLRHFLMRTHFGVKASELAAVQQMGLPAYVAQMLQLPPIGSTPVEQAADQLLLDPTAPPSQQDSFPTQGQCAQWWEYMLQRTTTPFQEVVALFWHDHFAASTAGLELNQTWWTKGHVNLWRGRGTGNLKDLCLAMARDPLMLFFLDGVRNAKFSPNENFGREYWELFTLGADNGYVQADIVEAARAWTGYRERGNLATGQSEVVFDPILFHDPNDKTIFGVLIPGQNVDDDFQAMVDITFAQRPVETFIVRKILEAFCYDAPPQSVVDQLGALLRQSNWELAPVFTTLFLAEAFYSPEAKAGFVKGPVEMAIGFIRSTGILAPERSVLDGRLNVLGQRPTQPPTVNGWPVGNAWLSSSGMVDRANLVNAVLSQRAFQQTQGFQLASLLPPPPVTTGGVVDHLASTLNLALTPAERAAYVTYLDTTGSGTPSPFNPANPTHVDLRLRGLLYALTPTSSVHGPLKGTRPCATSIAASTCRAGPPGATSCASRWAGSGSPRSARSPCAACRSPRALPRT